MQIAIGRSFILPLPELPTEAIALVMVWLPPGTFLMGSPPDELNRFEKEEQQFEATINLGFWLGKYLITQAQWRSVMGYNPSHFQEISINCPVDSVTWYEAIEFCQSMNELFADHLPTGYRFNLPTEVQWEYACRAGTKTIYNTGNALADLNRAAWHKGNSSDHPHPVGEKEPNGWGLYDMHGNTAEWCFDPTSAYPNAPVSDWVGVADGYVRSIRSSSWGTTPEDTGHRCACRGAEIPDAKVPWFGFRVCLRQFLE